MNPEVCNLIIEFHFKDKEFDETFGGFEIDTDLLLILVTPKDTDKTQIRISEYWKENVLDYALKMLVAQDVSSATEEHLETLLDNINIRAVLPNDEYMMKTLMSAKELHNTLNHPIVLLNGKLKFLA